MDYAGPVSFIYAKVIDPKVHKGHPQSFDSLVIVLIGPFYENITDCVHLNNTKTFVFGKLFPFDKDILNNSRYILADN